MSLLLPTDPSNISNPLVNEGGFSKIFSEVSHGNSNVLLPEVEEPNISSNVFISDRFELLIMKCEI